MKFGKLGAGGLGLGVLTSGGGGAPGPAAPTAPVLAWASAETINPALFTAIIDDSIGENDLFQFQTATDGTSFAAPIDDITDTVTNAEDLANQIATGATALANGNYEARMRVATAAAPTNWSSWSNTVDFNINASTSAGEIFGLPYGLTKAA